MDIAMGKMDMYIMMRYETCTAGCKSAMFTTEKPAVRVEAAWKRPARKRWPPERVVTVGSWS
jgi:hypothetical protein